MNYILVKIVFLFLLVSVMILPSVQKVLAGNAVGYPQHRIVLPFYTDWDTQLYPYGTTTCGCNQIYSKTASFSNSQLTLLPVNAGTTPKPRDYAYGYGLGAPVVMQATGYFGASGQSASLDLFANDTSAVDPDWTPPFLIMNHTTLDVWYFHDGSNPASKYVMLDAQIYDSKTGQVTSLANFYSVKTGYVVDQNGVGINPTSRGTDNSSSWQHAAFSLDPVYYTDPNNWWVMRIWVSFANGASGPTGQAVTYFADMDWTYAISVAHHMHYSGTQVYSLSGDIFTDTIVELVHWQGGYGSSVEMRLKVTTAAYSNATYMQSQGPEVIYPHRLQATAPSGAGTVLFPNSDTTSYPLPAYQYPTGVHLSSENTSLSTADTWAYNLELGARIGLDILSLVPGVGTYVGTTMTAVDIAQAGAALTFWALPQGTPQEVYNWPDVNNTIDTGSSHALPTYGLGELIAVAFPAGTSFSYNFQSYFNFMDGSLDIPTFDTASVSAIWSDAPQMPPSSPPQYYSMSATTSSITLYWHPPQYNGGTTIVSYNLYRCATQSYRTNPPPCTPTLYVNGIKPNNTTSNGNLNSYTDNSVPEPSGPPYTYYWYYITSVNNGVPYSESSNSIWIQALPSIISGGGGCGTVKCEGPTP